LGLKALAKGTLYLGHKIKNVTGDFWLANGDRLSPCGSVNCLLFQLCSQVFGILGFNAIIL
jgi:hypothetical protein